MTETTFTRRRALALTGGTITAGLAGCVGGGAEAVPGIGRDEEHAGVQAERDVYVATYHWGFAAFDEDGTELDVIELEPNTELTIYAVNDHAYDALENLPDPVAAEIDELDALERTKRKVDAGELPDPEDTTVEAAYEKAHGDDHDDGHDDGHDDDHDDDGHDDGHDDDGHDDDHDDGHDDDHDDDDDDGHDHDDGMLDHGFAIPDLGVQTQVPWDKEVPVEETVLVEEPGTYEAVCTVHCGYFHTEQQEELIVVGD